MLCAKSKYDIDVIINNCVRVYDLKSNGRYIFFLKSTEAVAQRCSVKKLFIEISQNSYQNTCVRVSFFVKLQASICNFIKKETLAQVFPCEFCKIFKNTLSYRTPPVAASVEIYVWKFLMIYFYQNMWIYSICDFQKLCKLFVTYYLLEATLNECIRKFY